MVDRFLAYEFRWSVLWEPPYHDMLLDGIRMTLLVSPLAWSLACIVGVIVAVCRTGPWWLLRGLGTTYVEFFRNTPLLVQLFFWYFGVPQLLPSTVQRWLNNVHVQILGLTLNVEAWTLIVGLAMYTASRVAEIPRHAQACR